MCGIAGGFAPLDVDRMLEAIAHRGPDGTYRRDVGAVSLGAVRLAIQDPDERSASPFAYGSIVLAYNGELWNAPALRDELRASGRSFSTTGDTEVVAAMLDAYGEDALPKLEGMFAIAWTDGSTLRLARDRFGEVPLHATPDGTFASETKALDRSCSPVGAGEIWRFEPAFSRSSWYSVPELRFAGSREEASSALRQIVDDACRERAVSDVGACTLLSGGLDSSAIAFGLSRIIPDLVAYTAVMDERSPDLRSARLVADALGIRLVEVRVPEPTADDLARVVRTIEMPSKAQVEIAWPCLALADAIHADGQRVTFSGEGSDELWASYGFAYHGIREKGWYGYRRALFADQARRNFPRANKSFAAYGVECRLPFLHTRLVEFALSLPESVVREGSRTKAVLGDAFADVLPASIIRRSKLAFQDGLGMKSAAARAVADPRAFYLAEYQKGAAA